MDKDLGKIYTNRILKSKRCFSQAGFSLTEILVVLVILTILTLFAVLTVARERSRTELQEEAIALATRLESSESFAKLRSGAPTITQFRIRFDATNQRYIPEMYNTTLSSNNWVSASAISQTPFSLPEGIIFGNGSITSPPSYGQGINSINPSREIRFNTRGFPAQIVTGTATDPQAQNEIYLTDGKNYFAITVSILGRVQVWKYISNSSCTNGWCTITG